MRGAAILMVLAGTAFPYAVGYHVDSVQAQWSAWTSSQFPNNHVSQFVTCNFDSLSYVELFAGELGAGSQYVVTVFDDAKELARSSGMQMRSRVWVKFENWNTRVEYTKGKEYEFRFTRSGGDSVQYHYQGTNPYPSGHMRAGSAEETGKDLCCRVYGRMKPVSDVWRACVNHGNDPRPESGGNAALDSAESMGGKWLRDDFTTWEGWTTHPYTAKKIYDRYLERGFSMTGILCYGPDDTSKSSQGRGTSWAPLYPPRNLYEDVGSDSNWWAAYCRSIMDSMPEVKYWEVWPEANAPWCWQDPDTLYQDASGGLIDTPRERCSLYVRMCCIAESTAHMLGGGRKVIGGAVWRLVDTPENGSAGVDWLRDMFDLAEHYCGGIENCLDIVSVHPYMHHPGWRVDFIEDRFRVNLDTARWVMRQAGYPGMELWATEYGWPRWSNADTTHHPPLTITDTLMQARNLCQFYTSAIARQTDPRGGYDRAFCYELTGYRNNYEDPFDAEGYGLLDSDADQTRLPQSWAMQQAIGQLTGRCCNGRVITGESVTDSLVRMYEFEDPATRRRTWVCWADGDVKHSIKVKLPVRTDQLAAESLAYSSTTPAFTPRVADDGWLRMSLDVRPVFIHEVSSPERPDMRVDSVRFVSENRSVRAWVTNHGTRATPIRSGRRAYPTWAVLKADGDSLAQAVWNKAIGINQGAEFEFELGRTELPDTVLLNVTVNPNQLYVELNMDDNAGYTLAIRP